MVMSTLWVATRDKEPLTLQLCMVVLKRLLPCPADTSLRAPLQAPSTAPRVAAYRGWVGRGGEDEWGSLPSETAQPSGLIWAKADLEEMTGPFPSQLLGECKWRRSAGCGMLWGSCGGEAAAVGGSRSEGEPRMEQAERSARPIYGEALSHCNNLPGTGGSFPGRGIPG